MMGGLPTLCTVAVILATVMPRLAADVSGSAMVKRHAQFASNASVGLIGKAKNTIKSRAYVFGFEIIRNI